MTSEAEALRTSIIKAVQSELDRHAAVVMAETTKLRDEAKREREAMRQAVGDQLTTLARAVEQGAAQRDEAAKEMREFVEAQLAESEARSTRRLQEITTNIDALVDGAMAPTLASVREQHESLGRRIDGVDTSLRKFDEQAARMVTYFNDMTAQMETRTDELSQRLNDDVDRRIAALASKIDDAEARQVRQHNETSQMVTQRSQEIEDRINTRVLGMESRIKEDVGTRIADIDAHVGRVSAGLDDTLTVLNDRMSGIDGAIAAANERLDELAANLARVDADAIDELKDKLSAAAGEAMLVRIEVERVEQKLGERIDKTTVKLTDLETQIADQSMDVSTAVQLERLEELERAVIELDPSRFVLKSDVPGADRNGNGHGSANGAPPMLPAPPAPPVGVE
jgi:hypothetical protein